MPPGCWLPMTADAADRGDVDRAAVRVGGDAPRRLPLLLGGRLGDEAVVAGDETGDRHLAMRLGEIEEQREDPRDRRCPPATSP